MRSADLASNCVCAAAVFRARKWQLNMFARLCSAQRSAMHSALRCKTGNATSAACTAGRHAAAGAASARWALQCRTEHVYDGDLPVRHAALWCELPRHDATPRHMAAEGSAVSPSAVARGRDEPIGRSGGPPRALDRVGRHCGRIVRQVASVRRLSGTSCQLTGRGAGPRPSKDALPQDRTTSCTA